MIIEDPSTTLRLYLGHLTKMKGVILLVFTGALVYLVRKLFSFVKALQAIQYVMLDIRKSAQFYLERQIPFREAHSLFTDGYFWCCSTPNPLG